MANKLSGVFHRTLTIYLFSVLQNDCSQDKIQCIQLTYFVFYITEPYLQFHIAGVWPKPHESPFGKTMHLASQQVWVLLLEIIDQSEMLKMFCSL